MPGLLLLASFGVVEIWGDLSTRQWRSIAVYAAMLAAAVLIVERPVEVGLRSLDDYNSSLADLQQGRLDRAQQKLERALAANPDSAETNFALGNDVYLAQR